MADLLKLLFVFIILVVLLMRRANLGAVMVGISLLLGLLFQVDIPGFWQVIITTITNPTTLELVLALALIMVMEDIMRHEGMLERMVSSLRGLVGDSRVVMATLPALVGLIPSMGGAIFSAPMIEEVSKGSGATAERKTFINYWYRHIWEFVLPLYPALLLTAQVFGIPLGSIILLLLPVPVIAILAGWIPAFRGLDIHPTRADDPQIRQHLRDLAIGLGPVAVILLLVLVLRLNVAVAVGLVVLGLVLVHRYSPGKLACMFRESISWNVLFAVVAVLFFKEMLVASQAVGVLTPLLTSARFPLLGLFFALPFLVGMLTGAPQAFVGTAAPILIGLVGASAVSPAMAAVMVVSGYGGVMLSPAHLCLVLTTSYFKADLGKVYRMVILPEIVLVGLSLTYLAFLQ